jgi:hypothetical protein
MQKITKRAWDKIENKPTLYKHEFNGKVVYVTIPENERS